MVKKELTKIDDIKLKKINMFYKRSILNTVLKILLMENTGYRTFKSVKNINRLFSSLNMDLYNKNAELQATIWCICFISKKWLDGIVNVDLIVESCKRSKEFDNIKYEIIESCMNDKKIITEPEAKLVFNLITEALQYGFLIGIKNDIQDTLDEIDMEKPGAFQELAERLFTISHSLIDIKHNTNFVANKITFNSGDPESIKNALSQTIDSLSASNNMFKLGIRRWNTLLSPAYLNGRLYIYLGSPGSFKSGVLLKSAIDIRKYNPEYQSKTPGLKPCVLYITMENSFTETIERLWNMTFDDDISNYSPEEAYDKICEELGMDIPVKAYEDGELIKATIDKPGTSNIEIVIKYFSYREISTDDLFTIVQDLKDDGLEVCAFVFDYIKRIRPSIPMADNIKVELDRICNELKAMAVLLDIPVITAHQTNRAAVTAVDTARRAGKADTTKLVGREHVGSAWEVQEIGDWVCIVDIEYKPGTDERFLVLNVTKRRRVDNSEGEMSRYTYLAHPFSKSNPMKLVDDINLDKVLSLQSLVVDVDDVVGKEKNNAVKRLNTLEEHDFEEFE